MPSSRGIVDSGKMRGNKYTISTSGDVDAITGKQWKGIIDNYKFSIGEIAERVRWKGSMDFDVEVVTRNRYDWPSWWFKQGLMPSMNDMDGWDERRGVWTHSATHEQRTGVDLNGKQPDLGFYIVWPKSGKFKSNNNSVWIDPRPEKGSHKNKPRKFDDLISVITHELLHAMGFSYWKKNNQFANHPDNKFTRLTKEKNGKLFFTGKHAKKVYGSNVPIADDGHIDLENTPENYWTAVTLYGDTVTDIRTPSELDFAILKDIGWKVI